MAVEILLAPGFGHVHVHDLAGDGAFHHHPLVVETQTAGPWIVFHIDQAVPVPIVI